MDAPSKTVDPKIISKSSLSTEEHLKRIIAHTSINNEKNYVTDLTLTGNVDPLIERCQTRRLDNDVQDNDRLFI